MTLNQLPASFKSLTEANHPIRLRLSIEQGVADEMLMVKHVSGVETICDRRHDGRAGLDADSQVSDPVGRYTIEAIND